MRPDKIGMILVEIDALAGDKLFVHNIETDRRLDYSGYIDTPKRGDWGWTIHTFDENRINEHKLTLIDLAIKDHEQEIQEKLNELVEDEKALNSLKRFKDQEVKRISDDHDSTAEHLFCGDGEGM